MNFLWSHESTERNFECLIDVWRCKPAASSSTPFLENPGPCLDGGQNERDRRREMYIQRKQYNINIQKSTFLHLQEINQLFVRCASSHSQRYCVNWDMHTWKNTEGSESIILGRVQQHFQRKSQRPFSTHGNECKKKYDIVRESNNFVVESLFESMLCRWIGSTK
jgi:hypothetical protein